ncbi:MAG: glutamate--tRNA ligase [Candidatus Eisenbacteria bacterium]|uniref:Glutamate--tRNA ligase n=1 Tax=Eiseniibacteriota bacterium TaxID=2212470 RepID=A0A956RPB8_UNCEI|nr:glutamate--tRNA ligase [Candidatus Eisenbacteria bacterium]
MSQVRVRYAPSPTGYLHVGGLRTALYNYLYARKNGGVFVLRIEDTDQERQVEGAVDAMIEALRWSGLEFDEGPGKEGECGPYVQSERLALYHAAAERLLQSGHAYRCYRTPEELEELRRRHEAAKTATRLDVRMPAEEAEQRAIAGAPSVIRLRVPDGETIQFHDLVRGEVSIESDLVDDQVLVKSDGFPTYHLANVVDDYGMGITHVIRGEEWVSSTPKHVLLYRFLGFPQPEFAHLPLLLNPDRSKLSKRHGDVAVESYREKGYLAEALLNYVAFLGWNPGDERELFTLEELIGEFSLARVNKSGAIFNREKLDWYNAIYLRQRPAPRILDELRPLLAGKGWDGFPEDYLLAGIELMRERVSFVHDYLDNAPWLFEDPESYDEETVKKRWKADSPGRLREARGVIAQRPWTVSELEAGYHEIAEANAVGIGQFIHPTRLAVSGMGKGPGLYELLELLGRETCLRRIDRALSTLG